MYGQSRKSLSFWTSIFILVGCTAAFGKSQPPPPTPAVDGAHQENHSSTGNENPADNQAGTDKQPFVVKSLEAEKTPERTEQERPEREEKAANEGRLVWWTVVLSIATIGLAIIAGGQLVAFGMQARRLRQTIDQMKKSEERQLRAYVSATPTILSGPDNLSMRFSMINHGQTPAYTVVETGRLDIFPYPLPPNFQFPILPVQQNSRTVLHAHATNMFGVARADSALTQQEIVRMLGLENRIYIYGLITYTDVFMKPHRTEFCHSIPRTMNLVEFLKGTLPVGTPFPTESANQHDQTD